MVKRNLQAEAILGMRPTRSGPLYLVKWQDPNEDNTWLPLTALGHCLQLVVAFESKHTHKIARKTTTPAKSPRTALHLEEWIEVKDEGSEGAVRAIVRREGRQMEVHREGETKTVWVSVKALTAVQPAMVIDYLVAELRTKDLRTRT